MNDKELLVFAAKAANLPLVDSADTENGDFWIDADGTYCNPLTEDGCALQLAVNLGIVIQSTCHDEYDNLYAAAYAYDEDGMEICSVREVYTSDPYTATRRAIVRAAAEIGKGMK